MNVRVRCVVVDFIYVNNVNRKFCIKYGIFIFFVCKGRVVKDEFLRKVFRSEFLKERVIWFEGSFGI